MFDLNKLEKEKLNLLFDLDDEGMEKYLLHLSSSYYKAILEKDSQAISKVLDSFKLIVENFEYKYPDIYDYINYSLVKSGNKILGNVFDLDCTLWNPIQKNLSPDGLTSLGFSLDASRLKLLDDAQNIEEMYEFVVNDENVDDRVVEGMTNYIRKVEYF
ncbi:MAG: hypothetical protein IJP99_04420 [Methanobrevibacter sp.]|nr:hypothetical protein [Methanobrevibacter sp.]